MNKKLVSAIMVIIIALMPLAFSKDETTIKVNEKESIQDAVNSASAGDQIILKKGTWTEDLVIDKSLDIIAKDASKTIVNGDIDGDGLGDGTVFTINSDAEVTLTGMTITNGYEDYGGGINNMGMLMLDGISLSDNSAAVDGGGIMNFGTVTVIDSTISDNHADNSDGGGINNAGTATIIDSTISKNTAEWAGGIDNGINGDLTVIDSTISDNTVTVYGGGICNSGGDVNVEGSLISGNAAGETGGGIWNSGDLIMSDSTVSDNTAGLDGGGLYSPGTETLTNCNLIDNEPNNVVG